MQRGAVAAAAFAVLLGLAGCGDDDGDDETTDDAGAGEADVTIADFAFSPDSLTVAAGDSVAVTNTDAVIHTFTSEDAGFDLSLEAGESGEVTVDAEPGTYDFQCTIHPEMTGSITVE